APASRPARHSSFTAASCYPFGIMTATDSDSGSVVERSRPVAVRAAVVAAHFLSSTAVFVDAEEALVLVPPGGGEHRHVVHGGGILCSAGDGTRVVTGGHDGQVIATDAQGRSSVIATDPRRRWIDRVAIGPDGAVAWSAGKT